VKVKVARTAGFCGGVRRAVNLALDAARESPGPIHTIGPLVHNPHVVDMLESLGVQASDGPPEKGVVVIRAHGITPAERRELKDSGLLLRNATCKKVSLVHATVSKHHRLGYLVVVLGDPGHAEVDGIVGHADNEASVVEGADDVSGLPDADRVLLVAQTTQERDRFDAVARALRERYPGPDRVEVIDTICDATRDRQDEVRRLAGEVEAMVVVGGAESANTRRLVEVAERAGVPAFPIDSEDGLDREKLVKFKTVGLTAGASTPNWMIRRVYDALVEIGDVSLRRRLIKALHWLVLSNLFIAAGAASLTMAAARMMGFAPYLGEVAISFLFVFAAHTLTVLANPRALMLNVPGRARSFTRYRGLWTGAGVAALAVAVAIGFTIRTVTGCLLLALAAVIIIYPVRLLRARPARPPIHSLADVPGNKDIFMAMGWAALIVAFPVISHRVGISDALAALAALFLVAGLVFVRALLRDFRDIQADRLIGRETLPMLLGAARTRRLLWATLIVVGAVMAAITLFGGTPSPLGYVLLVPLGYAALCVPLFTRQTIVSGFGAEAIIDAAFVIAGAAAVAAW